jgi:predicted GTPase
MAPLNVIVFGETGSGKSSIVNMLAGSVVAPISSGAKGCTFKSDSYLVDIGDSDYNIFDTVGLGEAEKGRVSAKDAVINLYKLINKLDDGVSLLVYCVRGPRVKHDTVKNYQVFYEIFCERQVPIVIAVTGLENEDPMEGWWTENEADFAKCGMRFGGHACITATRGKHNRFSEEYEESVVSVKELIQRSCRSSPWKKEQKAWFVSAFKNVWNKFASMFDLPYATISKTLTSALKLVGLPQREADELGNMTEVALQRSG